MHLKKQIIFKRIMQSGFPFWKLSLIRSFADVAHVHSYECENTEKETSKDEKLNASVRMLETILSDFPENAIFRIEIKNSKTANGAGVIGPLEFSNNDQEEKQTMNGLSGFPTNYMDLGFVPSQIMDEKMKLQEDRFKNILENTLKEQDFRNREQRLLEKELQVKEKEKEYSNDINKAANGFLLAGMGVMKHLGFDISGLLGTSENEPEKESETKPTTPRDYAVNRIAEKFYGSVPDGNLSQVESEINEIIKKYQ